MNTPPPEDDQTLTIETPTGILRWPQPEEQFPMRHADWKRIRARVAALADPLPYLGQIGWTCAGIAGSAFLALAPWTAAYSQLPVKAQLHYAWVTPFLAVAGVATVLVAGFCLVASRKMRKREAVTLTSVLSDMDDCYDPHDPTKRVAG